MNFKIMVVDDESDLEVLIKQKFRRKIREQVFDFLFATSGRVALDLLSANPDIDLVLSDINMPEMDGLTLLSKIQEKNSLLKTVMVSAYGDMENIRAAMNKGAFDFVTKPVNFDDLELTIEKTLSHVKHLKQTIKAIRENNILKMYVDETVLHFMESKEFESTLMVNETIEGTVVFIDICEFTKISENEPADLVVNLLNQYFDLMVKEIINQKGVVDKFIGDAIMAFFKDEFHLDRAIDAALAIRNAINQLPVADGKSGFKPQIAIGINSGEMVSGNIGSSTLKRLDYTVVGDTVNVASRLQSAASAGQILITEKSYNQIKEYFKCKKIGEISMKNKKDPIAVFEVLE
ncbi:MAG TPA: adenylate/guanylate cyclase domain-containing protein [Saprospiraceae bacterium]|nr:adenylate/guanylate cyclase domain-containing protein [Saprospiraceae bacterium]